MPQTNEPRKCMGKNNQSQSYWSVKTSLSLRLQNKSFSSVYMHIYIFFIHIHNLPLFSFFLASTFHLLLAAYHHLLPYLMYTLHPVHHHLGLPAVTRGAAHCMMPKLRAACPRQLRHPPLLQLCRCRCNLYTLLVLLLEMFIYYVSFCKNSSQQRETLTKPEKLAFMLHFVLQTWQMFPN